MNKADTPRRGCTLSRRRTTLLHGLSSISSLRILYALDERELCVGELVETLGCSQPLVSQHLQRLLAENLVSARRSGRKTYYAISDPWLLSVLRKALETYRPA